MSLMISFPSTIHCIGRDSNALQLPSQGSHNLNKLYVHKNFSKSKTSYFVHQPLIPTSSSSWHRGLSLVASDAKSSGSGEEDEEDEEDNQALETFLKLYSAFKNQNIHELSSIIGDECQYIVSFFRSFQEKKQVLDFFTYLIRRLGNNIEFIVKPTLNDGMNVGVAWRLEWSKNKVRLWKGLNFYIHQHYHGKLLIRNVEMLMEPLLQMEPYRMKIFGYMMTIVDKLSSSRRMKKKALFVSLLVLIFMTVILFFSKPGLY